MSKTTIYKPLLLSLVLLGGFAATADAGIYIGIGRSRHYYGPPVIVPAPVVVAPAYYGPAYYPHAHYAPAYHAPAYYGPPAYHGAHYGYSSEAYYEPMPTGYYAPAHYPVYGAPAYPYRKMEVEYNRRGVEVEYKY